MQQFSLVSQHLRLCAWGLLISVQSLHSTELYPCPLPPGIVPRAPPPSPICPQSLPCYERIHSKSVDREMFASKKMPPFKAYEGASVAGPKVTSTMAASTTSESMPDPRITSEPTTSTTTTVLFAERPIALVRLVRAQRGGLDVSVSSFAVCSWKDKVKVANWLILRVHLKVSTSFF